MEWQEVVDRLKQACKSPYEGAASWKQKNGRKVIGWFHYDTPEEIIHAGGSLPLAILGSTKPLSRCDAHVQSFICSLVRSTMEMGLDGSLSWLDGIVFPQVCDSAQNVAGVFEKNCPTQYVESLFWPKAVSRPSARPYTIEEIRRFRSGLEKYLGHPIGDEQIRASIRLYNKTRGLLRRIAAQTEKLGCREKYEILKAALLMPKEEFNPLAEELLALLEKRLPVTQTRIPVVASGILWEPPEILDLFDSLGAAIVADDFTTATRYFATDVSEAGDPIEALADYHLNRIPFSCYHYAGNARSEFLEQQVRRTSAKGVVFMDIKFCDPEDYDFPDQAAALKKIGVQSIHLESEYQTSSLAQLRTRLEAFLEMVGGN